MWIGGGSSLLVLLDVAFELSGWSLCRHRGRWKGEGEAGDWGRERERWGEGEIYFKELVYIILGKFQVQNLQVRQARNSGKSWCHSWSSEAQWRQNPLFLGVLQSFSLWPSNGWMRPTYIWRITRLHVNIMWKIPSQQHLDCYLTKYVGTVD